MERQINIFPLCSRDYANGFFDALAGLYSVQVSKDKFNRILLERQQKGIQTFCAVIDTPDRELVVGTASIFIEPKFWGNCGYIQDVSVHPDHQRKKIGTLLVEHLLAVGDRQECYKCILECEDDLKPFYEKLGFHPQYNAMRFDYPHRV